MTEETAKRIILKDAAGDTQHPREIKLAIKVLMNKGKLPTSVTSARDAYLWLKK